MLGSVDATEGKVPDRNWAQLLGAAAVPVDEADLRIEDVEALVVRLLDFAVDEWLALEHAEEWPGNRSHDFDEADDRPTSEAAAVDRDMVGAAAAFADDRTRDEALWSVPIDHWRRVAPPFLTVMHWQNGSSAEARSCLEPDCASEIGAVGSRLARSRRVRVDNPSVEV